MAIARRFNLLSWLGQDLGGGLYTAHDRKGGDEVGVLHFPALHNDDADIEEWFAAAARMAGITGIGDPPERVDAGGAPGRAREILFVVAPSGLELLSSRLGRDPAMSFAEVHDVFTHVLSDLAALHAAGVVYRDLDPGKIILPRSPGAGGRARIRAFRPIKPKIPAEETHYGIKVPFPWFTYAAMDQIGRGRTFAGREDVYACATMIFECLAGKPPHPHKNIALAMLSKAGQPSPPLADVLGAPVNPRLEDFLSRGLARRPEDRLGAAEALDAWRALRDVTLNTQGPSRSPS